MSLVNCLGFYLLKLSVVKEEVGSVEVSKGISRVEADGGLVVLHGIRFIPHELLDQTSVCEELFCERVTLKRSKKRGIKEIIHKKIKNVFSLNGKKMAKTFL